MHHWFILWKPLTFFLLTFKCTLLFFNQHVCVGRGKLQKKEENKNPSKIYNNHEILLYGLHARVRLTSLLQLRTRTACWVRLSLYYFFRILNFLRNFHFKNRQLLQEERKKPWNAATAQKSFSKHNMWVWETHGRDSNGIFLHKYTKKTLSCCISQNV